jgi:flagellar motor switch protein FliN/FliY
MTVREILELDSGTVMKLTRSAGENIDVRLSGTLVGFGEIVIIENIMGVRITDLCGED